MATTKTVSVPIGMRKSYWAPIKTEPDTGHPTYDSIVDMGAAVSGTLTVTTSTFSLYGDDVEQVSDESFVSAQVDAETTCSALDINSKIYGHTYAESTGEDSGKDDHAPYGGYGYLEPVMLKDKGTVFRATFIRRCTAIASAEKADAATRAESTTPQTYKVSFKCTADNSGSWRVRKEFTGTGAEAAADTWLKSQFSTTTGDA